MNHERPRSDPIQVWRLITCRNESGADLPIVIEIVDSEEKDETPHVSASQNWADATLVLPPDCDRWRATVVSAMTNEPHSDSEPKRSEMEKDPNIRGRVEALKEKVSGLNETLNKIKKTLEEEP